MTEAEWLACTDPQGMLNWVRFARNLNERKLRLFACACCRRAWRLFTREAPRAAIETAERYADGLAGAEELRQGWSAVRKALSMAPLRTPWEEALNAALQATRPGGIYPEGAAGAVAHALGDNPRRQAPDYRPDVEPFVTPGCPRERAVQCDLLRDLVTPFAALAVSADWLAWGGGSVAALARAAYEYRQLPSGQLDPARLAVLADALEDAGCTDAEVLNHLRGPRVHVRGCWAVDLLLGRE